MRRNTADLFLVELNAGLARIRTEQGPLAVKNSTYRDAVWAAREIAMDKRQLDREDACALNRPILTLNENDVEMVRVYANDSNA